MLSQLIEVLQELLNLKFIYDNVIIIYISDIVVIIHYSTEIEQSSVFVSYRPSMYLLYSICVLSVCMQLKRIFFK